MTSPDESSCELPRLLATPDACTSSSHNNSTNTLANHYRMPSHARGTRRTSKDFLDGLRGLAALLVFNQHYAWGFSKGAHEFGFGQEGKFYYFISLPFIRSWFAGGDAAVTIFFVLSGYVLSIGPLHKLLNGQHAGFGRSLLCAVVRRPIRLYGPPLVVSFLFVLLLHAPFELVVPEPWRVHVTKEDLSTEIVYFAEVSVQYFNPFREHGNDLYWYPYNMVMWTLPIELKGSALVYGVLLLASFMLTRGPDTARPLIVSGVLYAVASLMLQLAFKWSMACFLLGMYLAIVDTWKTDTTFLLNRLSKRYQAILFHMQFFAGWYLLCQPAMKGQTQYFTETPGYIWLSKLVPAAYFPEHYYRYWQSWGALMLIHSLLRIEWLQRFLSTRLLRYLGKISFMLYLTHLIWLRVFGDRFNALLGGPLPAPSAEGTFWDGTLAIQNFGPTGLDLRWFLCFAFVLPANLWIADMGTKWIDAPIVKLSRMLTTKLGLEKTPPSKAATGRSLLPM